MPEKCSATCAVIVAALLIGGVAEGQTHSYVNADPEIEMYFYPTTSSNGLGSVRNRASTFGSYSGLDEEGNPVFSAGTGMGPARRGSFIVVSETSTEIPILEDPTRYRIDALTVTLTFMGSIGPIAYDNSPEDVFELTTSGGDDPGHPIEMWGIGLGGDYTTFGFADETEPEVFHSGDRRWPVAAGELAGPYQLYSVDPAGNDVENAVYGGYSATAPDNTTEPFTPSPFAVGRVFEESGAELPVGVEVPRGSVFEFTPDLTDPGIVRYIQESLTEGHLGFFFSSLHQPSGHSGAIPYPDFFLDNEADGPNPDGDGPAIALEVTIVEDLLVGDYNGNGRVEQGDLDLVLLHWGDNGSAVPADWVQDLPDGVVDQVELDGVLLNWGASVGADGFTAAAAVPEPTAWCLVAAAAVASLFWRIGRGR